MQNVDGRLWKMFPDRIEHGDVEWDSALPGVSIICSDENETLEVEVSTWNTW